jgi:subfamily B ATP-binding cassette protein MsbA
LHGRYYDLYTRQHGVETNLFLAPGEGDAVPVAAGDEKSMNGTDPRLADTLRLVRGESR